MSGSPKRTAKARFRNLGRKDPLVTRVVQAIEGEIFAGRLPVGTRLEAEREFAERLGVSRTVVREAVRILVTKGLLETRHGVGTTVRAMTREEIVKPLDLYLRSCGQPITIDQLHQVRSILEVENAGLAAEQATEADIAGLRELCAAMEQASGEPEDFAELDAEFHRRLAQTTHNPLLMVLLDSTRDLMAEIRALVGREHGLYGRVMPTHRRILERIEAHDAPSARQAMREHLAIAVGIQRELIDRAR
jgi:GntR family transcriptional regulator, transcriptional repressor for pyruvate dehydrogenase complex